MRAGVTRKQTDSPVLCVSGGALHFRAGRLAELAGRNAAGFQLGIDQDRVDQALISLGEIVPRCIQGELQQAAYGDEIVGIGIPYPPNGINFG